MLEIGCAMLLLVPRARRWAALVLTMLMLGAAGTHLLHGEAPRVVVNIVLAALLIAAALARRQRLSDGAERPATPASGESACGRSTGFSERAGATRAVIRQGSERARDRSVSARRRRGVRGVRGDEAPGED